MKKSYCILILVIFLSSITGSLIAQSNGDINYDGTVNIIDALIVAQYSVGLDPRAGNTLGGDVNEDATLTIIDALIIARHYVGLQPQLPLATPPPLPITL